MARSLNIFLLALLPFQFVWGAAGSYCQHEKGGGTSHFGHHTHKHQGNALKSFDESTPDKKNAVADADFECEYCHLSCARPLASVFLERHAEAAPQPPAADVSSGHFPPVPALIERPKWTLAA